MIIVLLMLAAAYFIVFADSRASRRGMTSTFRTFLVSVALTLSVFFYSFVQSSKPPKVDYVKIGWMGLIRVLNANLEQSGSPLRIPDK